MKKKTEEVLYGCHPDEILSRTPDELRDHIRKLHEENKDKPGMTDAELAALTIPEKKQR